MKPFNPLPLLPFILFSCHSGPQSATSLTNTSIYQIDSIRLAAASGDEKAARKQFLAAMDSYKNKKAYSASIDLFKRSILIKPTAQAYYELGEALLYNGSYNEAVSALQVAEKMQYKPLANVLFGLAAACANSKDRFGSDFQRDSLAQHYMEVALQMGYGHPEDFLNNPWFVRVDASGPIDRSLYREALNAGSNIKDPEQQLWLEFRNEFVTVPLPLTINDAWIRDHTIDKSINFDYEKFVPEMRTAKFSREVEKEYYYYAVLRTDSAYTALLYAGKHLSLESEHLHAPEIFFLVTYDAHGKIIDKITVAGHQEFSDPVKVFTIQPNLEFEVRDFKNVYKDDPEVAGYDTNTIVRTEPVGVTNYRIAPNGKFEKTNAPLAMR